MEADETLERKALRNTRALVDRLQSDETTRARRQRIALIGIACGTLLAFAFLVQFGLTRSGPNVEDKKRVDCEVNALGALTSERTEKLRADNPGMPFQEINRMLQTEGGVLLAEARRRCGFNPEKEK